MLATVQALFPGRGEFEMLQKIIERRGTPHTEVVQVQASLASPGKPRPSEEVWKEICLERARFHFAIWTQL